MTDFRFVTTDLFEHNGVRMNLSPDKMWVNPNIDVWTNALQDFDAFCEEKRLQTKGNTGFVCMEYISNEILRLSEDFGQPTRWEENLSILSNVVILGEDKNLKTNNLYLKNVFIDFCGYFLNKGCVLLPLIGAKNVKAPKWHAFKKPVREGEPYSTILKMMLGTVAQSRIRIQKSAMRNFFSSISFDDCKKVDVEVFEIFKKTDFFVESGKNYRDIYLQAFRVINDQAIQDRGRWFQTHAVTLGALNRGKLSEHFLRELSRMNILQNNYWAHTVEEWLCTLPHQTLKSQLRGALFFLNWLKQQGLDDKTALEIKRHELIRNNITQVNKTFFETVEEIDTLNGRYRTSFDVVEFFTYTFDKHNDFVESDKRKQCPFRENDKRRFESSNRKQNKSVKPVLPKTIMEVAKEILLSDSYAWAKKQQRNWYLDANGEKRFNPALTIGLYTLLSIPIRTIQMALLDSGEADGRIINSTHKLISNTHELAENSRRVGCLRLMQPRGSEKPFVGFYINTNKTSIDARKPGYEIPYHEPKLIEQLLYLRDWQMDHNPVSKLTDRSELVGAWKYQGNVENIVGYTFLFRNPDAKKNGPWQPFRPAAFDSYWRLLLAEVQRRLADEGQSVCLVDVGDNNKPSLLWKTPYTLHSLRTSGITHFIEAGVPLHVLAEFVCGHATLIMTLYYTKLGPNKINNIIQEASEKLTNFEEDEYFQELTEIFEGNVSNIVGHEVGLNYAENGDPGIWQVELDGICVAGRALCHEGGETTNVETGEKNTVPIRPDGFNCGRCKFHLTGPAFIAGQVTMINTLLYSLQDADNRRQKLFEMRDKAEAAKNKKRVVRLNGDCEKVELEITEKLVTLAARLSNLYASHDLMNAQEERNSDSTALITKLSADELQVRVEEARQPELVNFVANAAEFFPSIPDTGARVRQHLLFRKMAQENGMDSLLLKLSEEESGVAALHASNMLYQILARDEYSDLMEGRKTLEEMGLVKEDLSKLCDVAIEKMKSPSVEFTNVKGVENPKLIEIVDDDPSDIGHIRNQTRVG